MYRSTENPSEFLFSEKYDSVDSVTAHRQTPHFQSFFKVLEQVQTIPTPARAGQPGAARLQTHNEQMKRIIFISLIATFFTAAFAVASMQNSAPADPGQVILNRACTVCHNLGEITKFKGYYNRDQWADVVRTMRADGAQVQDSEVPALVDYLFRTYGKSESAEGDGRKILESSCVSCHELSLVTQTKHSKSDWQDVVGRMIGMGAKVEDAQVPDPGGLPQQKLRSVNSLFNAALR
jgi:cytochrome c5